MLNAFFKVGNLRFKSFDKPFGYLAQEHTALATRIEEGGIGILEQLLREHVYNLVCQFGRSENLVIAQVRYTGKDVGIVDVSELLVSGKTFLRP